MVGSVDGWASMWLLDVAFLDRMDVSSLLGEKREGSVKAPVLVPSEKQRRHHRSAKPAAAKMTPRAKFTHVETVLKSDNFSALGKQKMGMRAQNDLERVISKHCLVTVQTAWVNFNRAVRWY